MAEPIRIAMELGPKGKRVAVWAMDWPGLDRGAKTEEAAIERLHAYLPRYAPVAKHADLESGFDVQSGLDVVERYEGRGSTDFWGISFAFSSYDTVPMSDDELERELSLLQGCWAYFDDVRGRVSTELQKGPRGGGRDRDQIVRHTVFNEMDWGRKVGLPKLPDAPAFSEEGLAKHRTDYLAAIGRFHAEGKMARTWPLRYLIRHSSYHTMDHAWEMEDKDLTTEE